MSSTNRGKQREDHDKYYTPDWVVDEGIKIVQRLLRFYGHDELNMLEPCCGGGAIVSMLKQTWPNAHIEYFDISPDEDFPCEEQDFLDYCSSLYPVVTMSNPPFKIAQSIIEHAIEQSADGGLVVMLLRINFFGGQARSAWLEDNMPIECHVTPRRPKFVGKGTDSTEYAWFVWRRGDHPEYTKTYLLDTRTARYRA